MKDWLTSTVNREVAGSKPAVPASSGRSSTVEHLRSWSASFSLLASLSHCEIAGSSPLEPLIQNWHQRAQISRGTQWRLGALGTRSAAPCTQDDVGDMWVVWRRVNARLNRLYLDREVVTEQPGEVIDIDVVRRVDAPRLHVLAVLVV